MAAQNKIISLETHEEYHAIPKYGRVTKEQILTDIEALKVLYGEIKKMCYMHEEAIDAINDHMCYRKKPYGFPRAQ